MTLANAQRLLAHYEANMNDRSLPQSARELAKLAYADMLENLARRGVQAPSSKSKK